MINKEYLAFNPGEESYFYGSHLASGCVPRFIVSLTMLIEEDVLRQTMEDIRKRFPQMSVKIEKDTDGNNYVYKDNDAPFPVFHNDGSVIRTMGTEETDFHLLTVTYWEKMLIFDFHHVLGDGTGFIIFIKAVLYRYFQLKNLPLDNDGSILTVDQEYNEEEGENAYKYIEGQPAEIPDWYVSGRKVFNIPGISTDHDPADTLVQIRIPFDRLHGVAKSYKTSPVTFISPLFSQAIYEKYEDIIGTDCILTSIPVNLRPYYPTRTLRYFITIAVLAHSKLILKEGFENILLDQKRLLDEQTKPEFLNYMAQNLIKGMTQFREMPMPVEQKAEMMDCQVRESMKNYTYVITNVGKIDLPGIMAQYVTEFYPMLPTATCPFTIAITTWNNELMLSVTQRQEETDICERFVELLNMLEIPAYISDKFEYHTMRCKPL